MGGVPVRKFISLFLSILILCSAFTGVGVVADAASDSVKITLSSSQGLFSDISKTYSKGDVFEISVFFLYVC